MFVEAAKVADIAPGGMKAVDRGGKKIVVCNFGGVFYAVERICGHVGASLDLGTLDGNILTCPLHFAQYDVITGEVLSGPVPPDPKHPTINLVTYPVKVEADNVLVSI
ncbi:MAG: non-heme iron oxygenase ferredoxin subunit [Candidatus Omnitrophota bacterium]